MSCPATDRPGVASHEGPTLDAATASRMLESVFETCDVTPNSVPMEALASYTPVRKGPFTRGRVMALAAFALLVGLALALVRPTVKVTWEGWTEEGVSVYAVRVGGLLPVKAVRATLDGGMLAVVERDAKTYALEPQKNGSLVVTATLENGRSTRVVEEIKTVDTQAPLLVAHRTEGERVLVLVADAGCGVDYEGAYLLAQDGEVSKPLSYDEGEGLLVCPYPSQDMELFVPDKAGNMLHLALKLSE